MQEKAPLPLTTALFLISISNWVIKQLGNFTGHYSMT